MKTFIGRQRGLGIVELMVGITVGLIVAAGASMVAVNQINEHRRLMLETQVQQDLRTAADLLQQELRRAGFRGIPEAGVWAPANDVGSLSEQGPQLASSSPYASFDVTTVANVSTTASYLYARRVLNVYSAGSVARSNEHFGIRWNQQNRVLYVQLGVNADGQPNWQPITDPDSVQIDDFTIEPVTQSISLGDFCDKPCGTASTPACPTETIRDVRFKIVARARHDANIVRTLNGVERIRADMIDGSCPA